jgi:hypothetical protein
MSGDLKPVILNALGALLPTSNFYAFLEAPGTANEHIHVQVRKGTQYP